MQNIENISKLELKQDGRDLRRMFVFMLVSLVWVAAVLVYYAHFLAYEAKPAKMDPPSAVWPTGSNLELSTSRMNLVMFIHPKCPCTNASLTELAILMTRCSPDVNAYAVFLKPSGVEKNWERTRHWQRASEIQGLKVISDEGGHEARRFNATTSGETLLFGSDGKLLFAGGITGARGHEGDNQGLDSVVAMVRDGDMRCPRTGVFGCELGTPSDSGSEIRQGLGK